MCITFHEFAVLTLVNYIVYSWACKKSPKKIAGRSSYGKEASTKFCYIYASVGGAPEAYGSLCVCVCVCVCVYQSEELWQNGKELDAKNCTIAVTQ